jgi:hypothetical protein
MAPDCRVTRAAHLVGPGGCNRARAQRTPFDRAAFLPLWSDDWRKRL